MKISRNTEDVISDIKKFSRGKLKNERDVSILIEASTAAENKELFEDLLFTAKYLNGLGKIIQSNRLASLKAGTEAARIDETAHEKIRNEFEQNLTKLNKQITDLISNLPADDITSFENKYLSLNRTSLVNLTTLIYDLSWVKTYSNAKKQSGQ